MLTLRSMHNKCISEKFGSANFTFLSILCRVLRPKHTANMFVGRVLGDGTHQKKIPLCVSNVCRVFRVCRGFDM